MNSSLADETARLNASEKEKTKLRERQRRAITTKIFAGLRKYGGYNLPPRADINDVLRALAAEAGWVVEADGTTYRMPGSQPQNQRHRAGLVASSPLPFQTPPSQTVPVPLPDRGPTGSNNFTSASAQPFSTMPVSAQYGSLTTSTYGLGGGGGQLDPSMNMMVVTNGGLGPHAMQYQQHPGAMTLPGVQAMVGPSKVETSGMLMGGGSPGMDTGSQGGVGSMLSTGQYISNNPQQHTGLLSGGGMQSGVGGQPNLMQSHQQMQQPQQHHHPGTSMLLDQGQGQGGVGGNPLLLGMPTALPMWQPVTVAEQVDGEGGRTELGKRARLEESPDGDGVGEGGISG